MQWMFQAVGLQGSVLILATILRLFHMPWMHSTPSCTLQCIYQAADLQLLDIGLQGSVLILEFIPIALRGPLPLDVILGLLLYQPNALQHICDVVDPAFLHLHIGQGTCSMSAMLLKRSQAGVR